MTMYNLESISQVANSLYQKGVASVPARELSTVPAGPDRDIIVPEKINPVKPVPTTESGLAPVSDYYFLKHASDRTRIVAPLHPDTHSYDPETVRRDFPILTRQINGCPLIWFDNAATTQKPLPVINTLSRFYHECNSNVHRGAHLLATQATEAYEAAREKVRHLLGASSAAEIIFVRGTTEAINLVAQTYGRMHLGRGDEILISVMEHHSNIVPWQLLGQQTGAVIRSIPINDHGEIILGEYEKLLSRRTKLVAITQVSNVLGTINPVRLMTEMAHYYGARVMVDGAQAVPHFKVDVKELDADFYAFSGHKIYGPTGIGVLYGKSDLLETMPPWQGGGGMVRQVSFTETTYQGSPHKFEAGTVNIADAVGLGSAVEYLWKIGLARIERYEQELTGYAMGELGRIPGLHLFGTAPHKTAVIAFLLHNSDPDALARHLDRNGIAIRAGHHCAQPLLQRYGQESMLRVSFGLYNTRAEVTKLVAVIRQSQHSNN